MKGERKGDKIFLKMPKRRRDLGDNLKLVVSLLVIVILILFIVVLARDLFQEKGGSNARLASVQPEAAPTSVPTEPPQTALVSSRMLSCQDPETLRQLNDFFGPLPDTLNDRSYDRHPVRGLYCRTPDADLLEQFIQDAKRKEINAFIIDAKEAYGLSYQSKVPLAVEIGASMGTVDFEQICRRCHEEGILVIARVVVFKDDVLPYEKPEYAIRTADGEICTYPMEGSATFVNPYDKDVWQYIIDISNELISFGVDEIQYDYIRFPTGQPSEGEPRFHPSVPNEELPERYLAINRFLETARIEIQDKQKIPLGADLFASIMISRLDGILLGQDWETIGLTGIDNIGVMIYPSHFANDSYHYTGNGIGSQIGDTLFPKPDLEPYGVVYNALLMGLDGFAQKGFAIMRPYLQAFTANYLPPGYYIEYGATELAAQIQAVEDVGLREWQLWRPDPDYPYDGLASNEALKELEGPDPTVNRHQVTIPPPTFPE